METVNSQTQVSSPKVPGFVWWLVGIGAVLLLLVGPLIGGYNGMVTERNNVEKAGGNLQSEYQRRLDLTDNLVRTVQASGNFEQTTLTQVIEARSKATSTTIDFKNATPEQLQQFNQNQAQLGSALSRLLAVSEAYPQLKTTESFIKLQDQLEGTENRIKTSRNDYNTAVTSFNNKVQTFPTNVLANMFGFKAYSVYKADESAQKSPQVQFSFGSSSSATSSSIAK